ncbi:transposable element Tcb1 transposase [Trichonephila clavipes]|nr:transposable element Tcb1 transposase [Trichonephila clavipes]
MWVAEWNEFAFTDESHICLQHHDGRIRVWRHRGERMLNSCVMHRHTGPAPGITEEGAVICKWLAFQRIQTQHLPLATPTRCLNEEIFQPVSHTQIAFERCCLVKSYCDPSCKKQKCIQIAAYQDYGLSYSRNAARVGRDPMTVGRKWNRLVQDGNTERCARFQRPPITSSKEEHVTRITLMDRAATSRALSQELGHLLDKKHLHEQFTATWNLSSESMTVATFDAASQTGAFSLYQDSRIYVWRHRGERTLAVCIPHRHTGLSPGVMTWVAIGYTSRSPLVRIEGTLNSTRYIFGVLRTNVALPFIQTLRNLTFQQDNARQHVASIILIFPDTENIRLLPWSARSPNLPPKENAWSMVVERLARHHAPVTTVDELWYRVEAAWASVPIHALQSHFDSIPRRIRAVITAKGGYSGY